jgi:hypothetical protein
MRSRYVFVLAQLIICVAALFHPSAAQAQPAKRVYAGVYLHSGLVLTSVTGDRDAPPERYWSLPQVEGKFDGKHRNNAYDDTIAALVEREERALYPERREQIRNLLFVEYSKRLPVIPLLFLADRLVAVTDLQGWEAGSGNKFGLTVEQWFFAPAGAPASTK